MSASNHRGYVNTDGSSGSSSSSSDFIIAPPLNGYSSLFNNTNLSPKLSELESEFNPYMGYVFGGFAFMTFVNYLTRFTIPEAVIQNPLNSHRAKWKWKNIATSLVHSTITGIWAPAVFYVDPAQCYDMIYAFNHLTHALVGFSMGYFCYDFFDMYLYNKKKSTYELLLHHVCVITCFGIAAYTRHYLPYAALALVVEVNSIFLHTRQLCIIQGVSKSTFLYRTIALLNVATFVLLRVFLFGWMIRWIIINRDSVPTTFFAAGSIGLSVLTVMNMILFYRIFMADIVRGSGAEEEDEDTTSSQRPQYVRINPRVPPTNGAIKRRKNQATPDMNCLVKQFFDEDTAATAVKTTAKITKVE